MDRNALEHLLAKFAKIREEHGEAAWRDAMNQFGKDCITAGGQTEEFARGIFEDAVSKAYGLDWEALKREVAAESAPETPMDEGLFMRALQQQLPALKSQGQFTAFQASFEAFRSIVNGILEEKKDQERVGREALDKALETLRMATTITKKLEDVPEAATSPAAEEFKKPPSAFTEYDKQRALLSELQQVGTLSALNDWWAANRQRIDEVKTPSLRNPLIDAVREKKYQLDKGPQA